MWAVVGLCAQQGQKEPAGSQQGPSSFVIPLIGLMGFSGVIRLWLSLGFRQGAQAAARSRRPPERLPTDPRALPRGQPGALKASPAWDKDEFPRGRGLPSADRVRKRVHGLPGRGTGTTFRRARLDPVGGSWARAMGSDRLMGTECRFGVECPGRCLGRNVSSTGALYSKTGSKH